MLVLLMLVVASEVVFAQPGREGGKGGEEKEILIALDLEAHVLVVGSVVGVNLLKFSQEPDRFFSTKHAFLNERNRFAGERENREEADS